LKQLKRIAIGLLALLAAWAGVFCLYPLSLPSTPFQFDLKPGSGLRAVSRDLADRKLLLEPWSLTVAGRILGLQSHIKAGSYEFDQPLTALRVLIKITRGDSVQSEAKLIEGMTFTQFRALLDANPDLDHRTRGLPENAVLQHLGSTEDSPEGLFFPETYFFNKGGSDWDLLSRARRTMQKKLAAAWDKRAPGLPYENPYQALIMASIIEKETGKPEERPLIAAVFVNRLRLGMRLQTDPTVIYGMGPSFDGNIRKRDLLRDTPYNTYTRSGLPPTPIAMPGLAAIEAALHPAESRALYFVARGDGTHQFSDTLADHNQAVTKYQLKHH
jgi:UPF0755 protein